MYTTFTINTITNVTLTLTVADTVLAHAIANNTLLPNNVIIRDTRGYDVGDTFRGLRGRDVLTAAITAWASANNARPTYFIAEWDA